MATPGKSILITDEVREKESKTHSDPSNPEIQNGNKNSDGINIYIYVLGPTCNHHFSESVLSNMKRLHGSHHFPFRSMPCMGCSLDGMGLIEWFFYMII